MNSTTSFAHQHPQPHILEPALPARHAFALVSCVHSAIHASLTFRQVSIRNIINNSVFFPLFHRHASARSCKHTNIDTQNRGGWLARAHKLFRFFVLQRISRWRARVLARSARARGNLWLSQGVYSTHTRALRVCVCFARNRPHHDRVLLFWRARTRVNIALVVYALSCIQTNRDTTNAPVHHIAHHQWLFMCWTGTGIMLIGHVFMGADKIHKYRIVFFLVPCLFFCSDFHTPFILNLRWRARVWRTQKAGWWSYDDAPSLSSHSASAI